MADVEFADRLIREGGVALIPLSPFYREPLGARGCCAICLAKRDETVELAGASCASSAPRCGEPVRPVAPGAGGCMSPESAMPLRVTYQGRPALAGPETIDAFGATLRDASRRGATDLVVLPGCSPPVSTWQPARRRKRRNGPPAWMRDWSRRLDAAVVGGVMTRDGAPRESPLVRHARRRGAAIADKRHLFRMAGEHEHFTAGGAPLLAEFRGWKIAPLICYDLRFPVWSRRRPEATLRPAAVRRQLARHAAPTPGGSC